MKTMTVGVSTIFGIAAAISALFSPERDAYNFPKIKVVAFRTSAFSIFPSEIRVRFCTKYNIIYTEGVTSLMLSITSFVLMHNFILCPQAE